MTELNKKNRIPCLLCVEKHLAQAFVLGCELRNGYPDHLALAIGHLGEALDELPEDMDVLRTYISDCLTATQLTGVVHISLHIVETLLKEAFASEKTGYTEPSGYEDDGSTAEVEVTEAHRQETEGMPSKYAEVLLRLASMEKSAARGDISPLKWEGLMALAADFIAEHCPKTAALLRARRLMFFRTPDLAVSEGYGLEHLAECLDLKSVGDEGCGLLRSKSFCELSDVGENDTERMLSLFPIK